MDNSHPIPAKESPTPSLPAPSPQQPKELLKKRGINWVLILFIIGGLCFGSGLYLSITHQTTEKTSPVPNPKITQSVSPTPDPTTDWKTYTDKYYGGLFLIKYPPDWKVKPDDFNKYIFFESSDYDANIDKGMIIIVAVSDTKQTDIEQWFSDYKLVEGPNTVQVYEDTLKRITVGGIPALQYDISLQASETTTSFIKNNKIFSISINNTLSNNKQIIDAQTKNYDQILSTFKFLEPAISSQVTPTKSMVACTQEALLCPDGSSVGRTGPNCEFKPCPKDSNN
jgi:hypothetical protein